MEFKFEKLIIWQKAMEFGESMHKLAWRFSKDEIYNLSSQNRRAEESIVLNISESLIGQTSLEFRKSSNFQLFCKLPTLTPTL